MGVEAKVLLSQVLVFLDLGWDLLQNIHDFVGLLCIRWSDY